MIPIYKLKCPRCHKGQIDYKTVLDYNLAMCPNCHYYIHKNEFKSETTRLFE